MIHRILLSIFSVFSLSQLLLGHNYLSVAVLLPAKNHYQLQSALKSFNKEFPGIESQPIEQDRLHMTIFNVRIEVKDNLSDELKKLIQERIVGILRQSLKEHLRWVHPSLAFEGIRTFRNKIVATFALNEPFNKLIESLEQEIKNDATVKVWLREDIITKMHRSHENIIPHISLATIIKSDQGYTFIPTKHIPPFIVHHHGNSITAYWNDIKNRNISSKISYKTIAASLVGAAVLMYVMRKYW